MASKEELEAMGIETRECKECYREISEEEYKKYKGYCKNCNKERQEIERRKREYNSKDEELEEKGLLNQIDILQIDYQIKEGKKILLHSNFINKQELETLGK